MVTMMNKRLSHDKRVTYKGIALGCKSIADNFMQLSKIYSNAIAEDKELKGKYQFNGLPQIYTLIQKLGMESYCNLIDNGATIDDNEPLEINMY